MISPAGVYLLVSVVLFVVAVVVHFHSTSLSLPLSPFISILAAILPIAGFINAYIHPTLLRSAHTSPSRIPQLAPLITQVLQALVATILATLLLERVIPSEGLECALDGRWLAMWRAHDADGIRRIQDALECCGLKSVKDMAYPFPTGKEGDVGRCTEIYGRSVACKGRWRGALQMSSGLDFGVVVMVGLVQIIGLLLMREGTSWWTAWRSWGSRQPNHVFESSRPLLAAAPDNDDAETMERRESGYGGINGVVTDEEESGPRVVPSGITDRNAWREE